MLRERSKTQRQRGGWTPMEAQSWKKGGCLTAIPDALPREWESRKAYIQAPWSKPPKVHIEEREQARNTYDSIERQLRAPVRLYTDGSGYQGGIGAAVYPAYPSVQNESRLCNMGSDDDATVYAAELHAIEMALEVIQYQFTSNDDWRERLAERGAVIFTDNQAALKAIKNPKMPSGQVYLEGSLRVLDWCSKSKIQVELRWIPAHEGIPGNEHVDMLAKSAATTTDTSNYHNRSTRLAAAASKCIKHESMIAWEKSWSKGGRIARRTRRLVEAPNKTNLSYWKGLRKATTSVLIQLRTGIIGLAEYLSKIKRKTHRVVNAT
ncbi:Reverse transcriptase, putative [Penicillium digitatum]|nr:Reverse transcriptase, putative [Penicillium digitatum]